MINREDIVSEMYNYYHTEDKKQSKKSVSLRENKKRTIKKNLLESKGKLNKSKVINKTNKSFKESIKDDFDFLDKMSKAAGTELKESVVKSTEEYIEDALKEKGIPFDYNLDEDGYFVYQFKNEEDLQQADMIICDIVGDQYESNRKKLKIWLTNDLAESKILKEDLSFFEKEFGSDWRNIRLKDDVDSTEGGIAHEGETLGEFIDEVGTKYIKSLEDLNDALKVCGISPVERIEESLHEGLTLEESIKQSEDAVYESYLEGMRRYSKDDRLAKSYASCMHNFDISRLNELVSKKNGEKND